MDAWMDGWTEIPPVFYRTSSPLGPLSCFRSVRKKYREQGKGIADHILPLGDLLDTQIGLKARSSLNKGMNNWTVAAALHVHSCYKI